jgi:hypothetical protein
MSGRRHCILLATIICAALGCQRPAPPAELGAFIDAKEAQANALAAAAGTELAPEFKAMFAAARRNDLRTMSNIWEEVHDRSLQQYRHPDVPNPSPSHVKQWQPALETYGALNDLTEGGDTYALAFAREIIQSIPPGSIYFGGTSPGRFLVTALSKSQIRGEPFFTLTQNGLQDDSYLDYLRAMYGSRMAIPTVEDWQRAAKEAVRATKEQRRLSANNPDVLEVMELRERVARLIFEANPDREFYYEESFAADWMYPYLEPHRLIMKLNRQPTPLSASVIAQDREFWDGLTKQLMADPKFVGNHWARMVYSKRRSDIGALYAFRKLTTEAEYAHKQAVTLCPDSPAANYRLAQLYVEQRRFNDGIAVLKAYQQFDQSNEKIPAAIRQIENMKQPKPVEPSS